MTLTDREKKRADRIYASLQDSAARLSKVTLVQIAEMVRRESMDSSPDGHATDKRPKAGGGSGETSSTEAAVLLRLYEGSNEDTQDAAIRAAFLLQRFVEKASVGIERRVSFIMLTGSTERGRLDSTQTCDICGGPVAGTDRDRIVRGMGPVCYQRWINAKKHSIKDQIALDVVRWKHAELESIEKLTRRKCGGPGRVRARAVIVPGHTDPDDMDSLRQVGALG